MSSVGGGKDAAACSKKRKLDKEIVSVGELWRESISTGVYAIYKLETIFGGLDALFREPFSNLNKINHLLIKLKSLKILAAYRQILYEPWWSAKLDTCAFKVGNES